jgi:cell division protein DivIC
MQNLIDSRARLLFVVCLAVACYFAYTAVNGAIQNHRLAQDRTDAVRRVAELEDKKAHILAVKRYVASDAFVEQEARRRLGWVREGEVAFVVISQPAKEDDSPTGEWWERLYPR